MAKRSQLRVSERPWRAAANVRRWGVGTPDLCDVQVKFCCYQQNPFGIASLRLSRLRLSPFSARFAAGQSWVVALREGHGGGS
jgi:hypothetical protein